MADPNPMPGVLPAIILRIGVFLVCMALAVSA